MGKQKLEVSVVEHSAMKRRIAIETFRANGYSKLPRSKHYFDRVINWVMLRKGKVEIKLEWPRTDTFPEKRVARTRK